jgi:hypothetical protein
LKQTETKLKTINPTTEAILKEYNIMTNELSLSLAYELNLDLRITFSIYISKAIISNETNLIALSSIILLLYPAIEIIMACVRL